MMWLELTALDGNKTLVCMDRVDYISTGYELPGCAIHFHGGEAVRSVSEGFDTIKKAVESFYDY